MIKTLNNNQIALDKSTNLVYNTNMINDNDNIRRKENRMITITKENTIGSKGYIAGSRHIGLLPVGNYKVHNPVGGRGSRSANNETMLVPVEQPESVGYEGSFFTVSNFRLRKII